MNRPAIWEVEEATKLVTLRAAAQLVSAHLTVASSKNLLTPRLVPSRRWLELGWRSLRAVQPK